MATIEADQVECDISECLQGGPIDMTDDHCVLSATQMLTNYFTAVIINKFLCGSKSAGRDARLMLTQYDIAMVAARERIGVGESYLTSLMYYASHCLFGKDSEFWRTDRRKFQNLLKDRAVNSVMPYDTKRFEFLEEVVIRQRFNPIIEL